MKWPLDLFASIRGNQSSCLFTLQAVIVPQVRSSYTVMLDSQPEWVTNTSIWTWSQAIEQSMPTFSLDWTFFALEIKHIKTIVKVRG